MGPALVAACSWCCASVRDQKGMGMRGRNNKSRIIATIERAGLLASLAVFGCKEQQPTTSDDACVSDLEFFQESVYTPILAQDCANCHNESGAAKDTSFILRTNQWGPNYIEQNLEMFTQLSKLEYEGTPWILLKPTLGIDHVGGMRFSQGDPAYQAFQEMVERIRNPTECEQGDGSEFFAGIELLDEVATLRKATLSLAGRLPTQGEEQRVRDGGFAALDGVLDEVMREDEFLVRLKEIYNDHFLTDRYYPGDLAIGLLDEADFPTRDWFESYPEDQVGDLRRMTSRAVAREALELVAHVVRNDFAYTEILTADYTMVNYYSAQTYGVSFEGGAEYEVFKPARVPGIPHAGVLTTPVWLNRFSTTDTNRNRHRSRMLYEFFLATDVQALGSRPVDATAIAGVNPTRNDPNCTICHEVIDPVAGAFQNWDAMGRYRPPESGWYAEMLPTGFGDAVMPPENTSNALQWLADRIKNDPRFALSAVHIVYKGLTGQNPLQDPDDPQAPGYLEAIKAAKSQRAEFSRIAEAFVAGGYNLKIVFRELIKTPYYRAHNASVDLEPSRAAELADIGTGRLLTPEQLNRKIVATTGFPFRGNVQDTDYLLDSNWYRILYGGIDSDTVVSRISETNGVMANVAMRMANEMSCRAVARDFAKDPSDRVMFPFVGVEYQPEDENGFEVPAAAAAIRANIQYLVQRLWGEYLDINDPEINRIFALFIGVWEDGKRGLALPTEEGGYSTSLPDSCRARSDYFTGEPLPEARRIESDPNYTIRAWMAVITYMLSDYRYLHE